MSYNTYAFTNIDLPKTEVTSLVEYDSDFLLLNRET